MDFAYEVAKWYTVDDDDEEDAIEEDYKTLKDYFSPLVYKVEYKIEG